MPSSIDESDLRDLDLSGKITLGERSNCGGFSDVWRGLLRSDTDETEVAVKELRIQQDVRLNSTITTKERLKRRCFREVLLWRKLHHPHVVPLLGFTIDPQGLPTLISPWYSNGNVTQYIKTNPNPNRPSLALDAAEGLKYLHSIVVVHGDLKGENVLVDDKGRASLCDFGMSEFVDDAARISGFTTTAATVGGTGRFMCPELFDDEPKTTMTDIWAFGCLIGQILTDRIPYERIARREAVLAAIIRGLLPMADGSGLTNDKLWSCLVRCWSILPEDRPTAADIVSHLEMYRAYLEQHPPLEIHPSQVVQTPHTFLSDIDASDGQPSVASPNDSVLQQFVERGVGDLELSSQFDLGEVVLMSGYTTTYKGTLHKGGKDVEVAVKELRVRAASNHASEPNLDAKLRRRFLGEILFWRKLQHPNIVPLLGYTMQLDGFPMLVTEWYPNGNVIQYIASRPDANRCSLALDATRGLKYLHSIPLAHGDLKAENVLINAGGFASLTDFGMSRFIDDAAHITGLRTSDAGYARGSVRHMCPELLEDRPSTMATDVWAFGCLIVQILTGRIPYEHINRTNAVMIAIMRGIPPVTDSYGIEDEKLWKGLQKCWREPPDDRPTVSELESHLQTHLNLTLGPLALTSFGPSQVLNVPSSGHVTSLEFSPDGRYLAVSLTKDVHGGQLLLIWKIDAGIVSFEQVYPCSVELIKWSPLGERLMVQYSKIIEIRAADRNFEVIGKYQGASDQNGCPIRAIWLPDGNSIAYAMGFRISVQYLKTRTKPSLISVPFTLHGLHFLPDGNEVILAGQKENSKYVISAFNIDTMKLKGSATLKHSPAALSLSANMCCLLVSYQTHRPELWEINHRDVQNVQFSLVHSYDAANTSNWVSVQFGGIEDQFVIGLNDDGMVYFWCRKDATLIHSTRVRFYVPESVDSTLSITWNRASVEAYMFASMSSLDKITVWSTSPLARFLSRASSSFNPAKNASSMGKKITQARSPNGQRNVEIMDKPHISSSPPEPVDAHPRVESTIPGSMYAENSPNGLSTGDSSNEREEEIIHIHRDWVLDLVWVCLILAAWNHQGP
ncbi:hypothetical protein FRC03_012791 [Tulasnella sp. 419]|nr:hypothetical protein FRC03_012791 [Tulasnella sp. 419]